MLGPAVTPARALLKCEEVLLKAKSWGAMTLLGQGRVDTRTSFEHGIGLGSSVKRIHLVFKSFTTIWKTLSMIFRLEFVDFG